MHGSRRKSTRAASGSPELQLGRFSDRLGSFSGSDSQVPGVDDGFCSAGLCIPARCLLYVYEFDGRQT